ncbi:MAG TPA: ABC transporter substrate-binding protein [Casimicrobiaceae bacterium]|nr:ABC transporter substrate-binding protein [Casimicrobiaceae bacterium]
MKHVTTIVSRTAALLALAMFATVALAQEAPDALVKGVSQEVLQLIRSDPQIQAGNQQRIREVIETKLLPHFDFERMTALAMGRNWRSATPEQQKRLVDEFRTLLVRTYSGALNQYRDEKIDYKPLRMNPSDTDVVVHTLVMKSGGSPITMDYSMEKTPTGWKAYDVTVGGVSLVTTYRDEFNNTVQTSGVDGLIKALADKNRGVAK